MAQEKVVEWQKKIWCYLWKVDLKSLHQFHNNPLIKSLNLQAVQDLLRFKKKMSNIEYCDNYTRVKKIVGMKKAMTKTMTDALNIPFFTF